MATISDLFALALENQQVGNVAQAEWLCRQVLIADPSHSQAANQLGLILTMQGRAGEAATWLQRAIQSNPASAAAQCNLGNTFFAAGDFAQAQGCYEQAIRLAPELPEAHNNLGSALHQLGRHADAIAAYQQAIECRAAYPEAWYNLGNVHQHQGNLDDALRCYHEALRIRPDYPEAHNNIATILSARNEFEKALVCCRQALQLRPDYSEAHNNMAIALRGLGRFAEALPCCQQALRLQPSQAETWNNVANVLCGLERFDEAAQAIKEALRLKPDYPEGINTMGTILERQNKLDDALACFQHVLELQPDHADAFSNRGNIAYHRQHFDEAMVDFDAAVRLNPHLPAAHWNRAMLRLLQGDLVEGWPEYEWRLKQSGFIRRNLAEPRWDGEPLDGRTILLYAEQGVGDTLQFIRYVPLVKARGGKVVVECQAAILLLVASVQGIDSVAAQGGRLPAFDVQAPLLSMPGIFETSLATIPADVPYLQTDPKVVERWRNELEQDDHSQMRRFRIGIAWQGNPHHKLDRQRSMPLTSFAPLAAVGRVQLISLQYGAGTDQLRSLAGQFPVLDLESRLGDASESFGNIAGIMKNLDLVISCDSAIAHLAGALGVPTWVALPVARDWRWLLERADSPWYPGMRLFRQTEAGRWGDVFERMAGELGTLVGARGVGL